MKVVKAAAAQLSPVLYSREGTIEKMFSITYKFLKVPTH